MGIDHDRPVNADDEDIYYRYDERKYEIGDKIIAETDHIDGLKGKQLDTENFFRAHEKGSVRKQGIYLYKDEAHTKKQWLQQANVRDRYLYKLRATKTRFKGDVEHFNDCQIETATEQERVQRREDYFAGRYSSNPTIEYIADEVEVVSILGTPEDQKRIRKEQDQAKLRDKFSYDIESLLKGDDPKAE